MGGWGYRSPERIMLRARCRGPSTMVHVHYDFAPSVMLDGFVTVPPIIAVERQPGKWHGDARSPGRARPMWIDALTRPLGLHGRYLTVHRRFNNRVVG